jgi:hypothetical protein
MISGMLLRSLEWNTDNTDLDGFKRIRPATPDTALVSGVAGGF